MMHLGCEYISGARSVFFYCSEPASAVAVWSATAPCHDHAQLVLMATGHGAMGMIDEVLRYITRTSSPSLSTVSTSQENQRQDFPSNLEIFYS